MKSDLLDMFKNYSLSLCTVAMLACVTQGCSSESEIIQPKLTDESCRNSPSYVYVNDELITGASVRFYPIEDSDSVRMEIIGVYPDGNIEMNVATTGTDDKQRILFEGHQKMEGVRNLKVEGFYLPKTSSYSSLAYPPTVNVKITYTVPEGIASTEYTVYFNEWNGINYSPFTNIDRKEIWTLLSKLNSEIGKRIKSITFRFEENGQMEFEYTTQTLETFSQTFRYWIDGTPLADHRVVRIENAPLFYKSLYDALLPSENRDMWGLPHIPEYPTASLYIGRTSNYYPDNPIVLLDDIHAKIFQYLYYLLINENTWTDLENLAFKRLASLAESYIRDINTHYPNVSYELYTWAFANSKNLVSQTD